MPSPDLPLTDESTREAARAKLDAAADTMHSTVDRVHQRASDVADRVTRGTDRYVQSTAQWISEHPMQALLGAMVAGYLFARMRR